MCVGQSSGTEDQVAGPCLELRVADCEDVLTLEDVEELIMIVVNVGGVSSGSISSTIENAPPVDSAEARMANSMPR